MATYLNSNKKCSFAGLSTDEKPLDLESNGCMFYEMDTGDVYMYDKPRNVWYKQGQNVSWFVYNR